MKFRVTGVKLWMAVGLTASMLLTETTSLAFAQQPTNPAPVTTQQGSVSSDSAQRAADALPEAPQASQDQSHPAAANATSQQSPSGDAAAKAAPANGAPVSQPVGAAIAPAKQSQRRSLLIKLGLVAGACVAVGAVAALSKGSPSRPPGAQAASSHP